MYKYYNNLQKLYEHKRIIALIFKYYCLDTKTNTNKLSNNKNVLLSENTMLDGNI